MTAVEDAAIGGRVIEIVPGDVLGGPRRSRTTMASSLQQLLAQLLMEACAPYYSERLSTAQEMKGALSEARGRGR